MGEDEKYLRVLRENWGYDSFRSIQLDIIRSIGRGRDTLGLMPTGGGKSITFQVPALTMDGVCIVVTPLVALMKDQVQGLRRRGILAHAIHSALSHQEVLAAYDNCVFGAAKFLYVSPERLASDLFVTKVRCMRVALLVVDEAHCISQWGYDFRPSYLRIADVRDLLPDVPVLALTATATPQVANDIMAKLRFSESNLFKMSFERQNIAYIVRRTESKEQQMVHILSRVEGSAIVYVRSRMRTREYADLLTKQGFSADFFHAGLDPKEKDRKQEEWTQGKTRVIVCTNAFGMGIDKPDVRLVIHVDPPESLEAYFQEAGRAGRDGKKSYAVFLWSSVDAANLRRALTNSFPDEEYIVKVYNLINNRFSVGVGLGEGQVADFDLRQFCNDNKLQSAQVVGALSVLGRAGYLEFEPNVEMQARLMFNIERGRLYGVEEQYPHLDGVIRALLRLYTGIFMEYARIDEERIAKACSLTRQDVYERLLELDRLGVVTYNPQRKASFLTWLREREHERYMVLPKEVYGDRLADAQRRIESVVAYCNGGDKCRSRILLEYFGDDSGGDCGQCDVCVERRRAGSATPELYKKAMELVKERLAQGPMPYETLCDSPEIDRSLMATVVRELVNDGVAIADVRNVYSLVK